MPELRKVPMGMIDEPALPARSAMDEQKLATLMDSMRQIGLLQPIGLKLPRPAAPSGGNGEASAAADAAGGEFQRFEIEFGHRRYMAARNLGWFDIMALVFQPGEIIEQAAKLAENIEREDLGAGEEAVWLAQLMETSGNDTDAVAAKVRKSRDYVEDRLRLLQGDEKVFEALLAKQVQFSVARELNKCKDEALRRMYLGEAIRGEVGARTVRAWIQNSARENMAPPPPATADAGSLPPSVVPAPVCVCILCQQDRDPYNMQTVHAHHWCIDYLKKIMAERGVSV